MAIDYNDPEFASNYVYMPKVGETAEFDIDVISKVNNPKFNFKREVEVEHPELGKVKKLEQKDYYIQATLKDGKILSITNEAAFKTVFKANNIQDGEKWRISHKGKGEWEVTKL